MIFFFESGMINRLNKQLPMHGWSISPSRQCLQSSSQHSVFCLRINIILSTFLSLSFLTYSEIEYPMHDFDIKIENEGQIDLIDNDTN